MTSRRVFLLTWGALLIAGCGSSSPSLETLARARVLVVGDIPSLDKRIHTESQVCGAFAEVGIPAVEACSVFPMESFPSTTELSAFLRKHQIPWLLVVSFKNTNAPLIATNPPPQTVMHYSSNGRIDVLNSTLGDNPNPATNTAEHLNLPPQIFGYLVEAQTDSLMWKAEMSTVRAVDLRTVIREFSVALAQQIAQNHLLDMHNGR